MIVDYCKSLGKESWENVRDLARREGVLNPKNRDSKMSLCAALSTKLVLGLLEDEIKVDEMNDELKDMSFTFEPMNEAVVTMPENPEDSNVHTYQKDSIEKWIKEQREKGRTPTDPTSGIPIQSKTLPNWVVRKLVEKHFEEFGSRPLETISFDAFVQALKDGDVEMVQRAVSSSSVDVNARVQELDNQTPLIYASRTNYIEIVKELLKAPRIDVNKTDKYGLTALFWAARKGNVYVMDELLKAPGMDVNMDVEGSTVLVEVAGDRNIVSVNVIKTLLKAPGIDVNKANRQNQTPLYNAVLGAKYEFVEELLKAPGIDVNKAGYQERTPLWQAATLGLLGIVKLLLQVPGIDVNKANQEEDTPLNTAAIKNDNEIVEELLDVPGIDVNKANAANWTPLHSAVYNDNVSMVRELLKVRGIDVNAVNHQGHSALMQAVLQSGQPGANLIIRELLKKKRIDVNYRNEKGKTALGLATDPDMIRMLKKKGAKK